MDPASRHLADAVRATFVPVAVLAHAAHPARARTQKRDLTMTPDNLRQHQRLRSEEDRRAHEAIARMQQTEDAATARRWAVWTIVVCAGSMVALIAWTWWVRS